MKFLYCFVLLTIVAACVALPTKTVNTTDQSRSILSSFWEWITYPFSGWGSAPEPEIIPPQTLSIITPIIKIDDKNKTAVAPPPNVPAKNESAEVGSEEEEAATVEAATAEASPLVQGAPNDDKQKAARIEKDEEIKVSVNIVCDDQQCTTTYCPHDGGECTKKTCNIYDTNMTGECQEFAHLQMLNAITEQNRKEGTTLPPVSKAVSQDNVNNEAGFFHSLYNHIFVGRVYLPNM